MNYKKIATLFREKEQAEVLFTEAVHEYVDTLPEMPKKKVIGMANELYNMTRRNKGSRAERIKYSVQAFSWQHVYVHKELDTFLQFVKAYRGTEHKVLDARSKVLTSELQHLFAVQLWARAYHLAGRVASDLGYVRETTQ